MNNERVLQIARVFLRLALGITFLVPKSLIPGLAVLETIIELGLGVALVLGIYQRVVAWSSAALLMLFALTMSIALGITAPLSYSVFTAFGAALLLGAAAVPYAARSSAGTRTAVEFVSSDFGDRTIA
jgi:hypothetical protein